MDHLYCAICGNGLSKAVYRSLGSASLTSLSRVHSAETNVFICSDCGHLQTQAMANVELYYDMHYDILVESEEEDQIYEIRDGDPIYRTEHQVKTLKQKIDFTQHVDLLDYGCAKSSTIRALSSTDVLLTPFLFDVSKRYIPFWEKFADQKNWAVSKTKPEWLSRFDVVTSFFSLEHIPTVVETMRDIASLLKPDGIFYGVVPNVFSNIADLIVVDHCNHFTPTSLKRLIADAGLELQELDEHAHRGAFVIIAKKPAIGAPITPNILHADIKHASAELTRLANFWHDAAVRLRTSESKLQSDSKIAIYGAGFYGAFISANLVKPARVAYHLDQNPHLQGKEFNSCPIIAPSDLPQDIEAIFVGLNPVHARAIISSIPALVQRKLDYFFL